MYSGSPEGIISDLEGKRKTPRELDLARRISVCL